ncbi:hypothetical protein BDP27DRAFT_1414553 [Rhodocollybia butyracea]|uniref:Uncharacterized protein n=1 Tax=Rhodocollybia butyracea TaxID=206335 RepID=A0A9P5Q8B4_9AGAR|nr:hypothetical protein BDP27DRAFT_1414553 [Rhodocollybia butyracea]
MVPVLTLAGVSLQYRDLVRYVGIRFQSASPNIFLASLVDYHLISGCEITPDADRAIFRTLEYLIYVVRLPPTHYALLALRQQVQLYADGHPCWLADLAIAIHLLPRPGNCYTQPLTLPSLANPSPDIVIRDLEAHATDPPSDKLVSPM